MLEALGRAFAGRSGFDVARDVLDVLVVAYVIYRLLLIVRGTRAMQMGTGLLFVFFLYLAARTLQLVTLLSLLSYVLSSLILIVVVVFQNDIRRALIRVGGQAWLGRGRRNEQSRVIDEVVAAVTELARHRIGAIIAFEQDANLLEFTKSEGTSIGAAVTRELLVALFYPESVNKLHDGAVIVRDLKIDRAGVFFPMPDTKLLDASYGTRHRAALGITEETDAVVVVVSEERGTISICYNGNLVPNIDGTALRQTLVGLLDSKAANAAPAAKPPTSQPTATQGPPSSNRSGTTLPPPPVASAPPTATPLPKAPLADRLEKVKAEAARSLEEAPPLAKRVSMPMPRTTRSLTPPSRRSVAPSPVEDEAPTSDRPSFVTAASEALIEPRDEAAEAPRSEDP